VTRRFTGWHMATLLVAFFGVVVTVNLVMARYAGSTFGGVVVENSYVASQHFNRWLDESAAEKALGWTAVTAWRPDGRLAVTLEGPDAGARLAATARHPLGRKPDVALAFDPLGDGRFVSRAALPAGRWLLRLEVADGGQIWRREEELR
jgi:nitrogen fixation protein FixH